MPNYSMDEIARFAYDAGFRGKGLSTAVAVSKAEDQSSDPTKVGRKGEKGLWQIYPKAHPDWDAGGNLFDPNYNARAAFAISSGGTNWRPWATWPLLSSVWLPQAEVSAQRIEHLGGAGALPAEAGTHVPGLGSGTEVVEQNALSALTALPEAFNRIGQWISSPGNWFRVAEVIIGGGLLLAAIGALARPVTEPVAKTAVKLSPYGRAYNAWWGERAS